MKIRGSITNKLLVSGLVIAAITIFSCKKELSLTDAQELQANITSSESDAEAEDLFNGVFDDVNGENNVKNETGLPGTGIFGFTSIGTQPTGGNTGRGDSLPQCATVTILHLNI